MAGVLHRSVNLTVAQKASWLGSVTQLLQYLLPLTWRLFCSQFWEMTEEYRLLQGLAGGPFVRQLVKLLNTCRPGAKGCGM